MLYTIILRFRIQCPWLMVRLNTNLFLLARILRSARKRLLLTIKVDVARCCALRAAALSDSNIALRRLRQATSL
jgi:hypothetical protein